MAILLVVAAHAGVPWLEGGYVGVDVFFVLSGYLITRLLVKEASATGKVHLVRFYGRRMKRLLPALIVMVLCTTGAAAVWLSPMEHFSQAASARAAVLWLSNLHFAFTAADYFSPGAESNLFLHTWSLGVEEQFYLLWPLTLLFFLGSFRWQGAKRDLVDLRYGLALLSVACFLLSWFLTVAKPLWAFYLMPSRAWEFGLGAMVALSRITTEGDVGTAADRSPWPRHLVSTAGGWVGALLILGAALFLDDETAYPGIWATAPTMGAALLLYGRTTSSSVNRFLSTSLMQGIGRVSYSWYLWHWPVITLGRAGGVQDPFEIAVLVALSFGLAVLSYRFVEAPIRYSPALAVRHGVTISASLIFMAFAATAAMGWERFARSAVDDASQKRYFAMRTDLPVIYRLGCDDWFYDDRVRICAFGEETAEHTAVLIGDSIMGQWFPAIQHIYGKESWRLLVVTKSSCPMVDEEWFYERIGMNYVVCSRWRTQALATIAELKPDVVVIGSGVYDFTESQWIEGTRRVLAKIAGSAGWIYLVRPTPRLPFDALQCLARRDWRPVILGREDCSADLHRAENDEIYDWLKQSASDFANVSVIDLNPVVCPDERCDAERDGHVIYRDTMHLTARYVASLGDELEAVIAAYGTAPDSGEGTSVAAH